MKKNTKTKKTYLFNNKNVLCCEKKTKTNKYLKKDNFIVFHPQNICGKKNYRKTNSCNKNTQVYDKYSDTTYLNYEAYIKDKDRLNNHKVIIIGAGPSGITAAYYLIKGGLSKDNITILEKSNRIGGQSNTRLIDGEWVESGTSYLTNFYKCVTDIAHKVDVEIGKLPNRVYASFDNEKYKYSKIKTAKIFKRYINCRKKYWEDKGELYNPSQEYSSIMFDKWLKKYDLEELLNNIVYIAAFHAQLYGWASIVSAHNALQWLTPDLLLSLLSSKTRNIVDGFQNLWIKVAKYYDLNIIFNVDINNIKKTNNQIEVYTNTNNKYNCNDVFVCCDFNLIKHPLSNKIGKFTHTNVYSARLYVDDLDEKFKPVAPYYVLDQKEEIDVNIVTVRNYGKNKKGKYIFTLCCYVNEVTDLNVVRSKVRDNLLLYGIKKYKIIDDFMWKYNIRYTKQQFKKKIPQLLEKSERVWYNSGVMSHWNVESIARHSLKKVIEFYEYNNFDSEILHNYKKKSEYDKITSQNFIPDSKKKQSKFYNIVNWFVGLK